jgi:hypothetical protein
MTNIYIGDIHGKNIWKDIVNKHADADNITFVGDYFDSYDQFSALDEMNNLQDIINYKVSSKSNVTLLIGNHDIHYWPSVFYSFTSGYQVGASESIRNFLRDNKHHFKISHSIGNVIVTHAGVSPQFLLDNGWKEGDDIVDFLNDLFYYKPDSFLFNGSNPYGDDVYQTPIWIRPKSLQMINKKITFIKKDFIQIVGHTQQNAIDIKGKTTGGKYYYIDTLNVGQYLIETDNKFIIGQIK